MLKISDRNERSDGTTRCRFALTPRRVKCTGHLHLGTFPTAGAFDAMYNSGERAACGHARAAVFDDERGKRWQIGSSEGAVSVLLVTRPTGTMT